MRVPSGTAFGGHHIICPFCESGELVFFEPGLSRCGSCGLPLLGAVLENLRDIVGLSDLNAGSTEAAMKVVQGTAAAWASG